MSVQNFIPQLWSAQLLLANRKNQTALKIVNRNYEGLISQEGDRVKINSIAAMSVADYTKNSTTVTYSALNADAQWLVLEKAKYWSCSVDDIDASQSNIDIMQAAMSEASYRLSDAADSYVYGLYASAGVTSGLGTTASPTSVTSSTLVSKVAEIARRLDDAHCPSQGRFLAVPPWFFLKIRLAKISNEMTTDKALDEGFADKIMGFNVMVSSNIATSGSATKVLAGTNEAITYADGLIKTEALRLSTAFADGLRGLHVYGAKVVKPDCLACFSCSEGAE